MWREGFMGPGFGVRGPHRLKGIILLVFSAATCSVMHAEDLQHAGTAGKLGAATPYIPNLHSSHTAHSDQQTTIQTPDTPEVTPETLQES